MAAIPYQGVHPRSPPARPGLMRFFRPVPRLAIAQAHDAQPLADLYASGYAAYDGLLDARMVSDLTPGEEEIGTWLGGGFEVYRALHDGRLVGAVRCSFPTSTCHVDRLVVHPDHRRRGFGQVLVEHAVSRARRAGVTRVWAELSPKLEEAVALFRGLGFREMGRVTAHESGEPVVLFELPV